MRGKGKGGVVRSLGNRASLQLENWGGRYLLDAPNDINDWPAIVLEMRPRSVVIKELLIPEEFL